MKRVLRVQLPRLRQRALRQGVFGGNNRWLAVWGALATARLVKRFTQQKPVVERFVLGPGQSLLITDLGAEVTDSVP